MIDPKIVLNRLYSMSDIDRRKCFKDTKSVHDVYENIPIAKIKAMMDEFYARKNANIGTDKKTITKDKHQKTIINNKQHR